LRPMVSKKLLLHPSLRRKNSVPDVPRKLNNLLHKNQLRPPRMMRRKKLEKLQQRLREKKRIKRRKPKRPQPKQQRRLVPVKCPFTRQKNLQLKNKSHLRLPKSKKSQLNLHLKSQKRRRKSLRKRLLSNLRPRVAILT